MTSGRATSTKPYPYAARAAGRNGIERVGQSHSNLGHPVALQQGLPRDHGLTLVHFSAQPEPSLTQMHNLHTLNTPYHPLNTHETTPHCTPCHTEGA